MFKKEKIILFIPESWVNERFVNTLYKQSKHYILLWYPSNKTTDLPFTVSPNGEMKTVDIFNPKQND